ncbi:MAG: type II toxin-antitoxin system VapC family toxin [Caldilineaceae bacterium]|nr:type II toxin-antitoxin system VapC family toxin [Caldilineaceae bacterium]
MNTPALLDTDILSLIMRRQPVALKNAAVYLKVHKRFSFLLITRYEILRGLLAKNATVQIERFEQFCTTSQIFPLNDAVVQQAASIYADLYQRGALINDADILIAATAQTHNLTLITNNTSHFQRITGLTVANWLQEEQ